MSQTFRRLLLMFAIAIVIPCGCGYPQAGDVVGIYSRTNGVLHEQLVVKADATYEQEINYFSGYHLHQTNTWTVTRGVIVFHGFYSSFDGLKGKDQEPPVLFTEYRIEIMKNLLLGDYDRGYFFRKKDLNSRANQGTRDAKWKNKRRIGFSTTNPSHAKVERLFVIWSIPATLKKVSMVLSYSYNYSSPDQTIRNDWLDPAFPFSDFGCYRASRSVTCLVLVLRWWRAFHNWQSLINFNRWKILASLAALRAIWVDWIHWHPG